MKLCNIKEMKCTKSVLFIMIGDKITQEKIQQLSLCFFLFCFFLRGGGGNIAKVPKLADNGGTKLNTLG